MIHYPQSDGYVINNDLIGLSVCMTWCNLLLWFQITSQFKMSVPLPDYIKAEMWAVISIIHKQFYLEKSVLTWFYMNWQT